MNTNKIDQLADNIYSLMSSNASSGKMSDLIIGFNAIKSLLKEELNAEFTRGYITAKNEKEEIRIIKQQKEN